MLVPWKAMVTLAGSMFVLGLIASGVLYLTGKHSWIFGSLAMTFAIGSLLVALSALRMRHCEKHWQNSLTKGHAELETECAGLQGQLAETSKLYEAAHKDSFESSARVSTLTRTNELLQDELNKLRQTERNLSQQQRSLERSKDVLELHVQSRTQELQKLQRRSESILNAAGEGICGLDIQGQMIFANPATSKITGWAIEEIIGKSEQEILRGANAQADAEAKEAFVTDRIFLRKDGVQFHAEYTRTNIYEGERVMGAVVIFKDITERKLSEERLSQKAAELARSNAELEQFAFVASHDLQEPLRKIQAFGERLKTKCAAADLGEGLDYLERMQNAAARMQRLINDLLTFSRAIRSSQPFTPVDLNVALKEVLTDLEVRVEQTGAVMELEPLPTIDAEPTQMRQLFQNLIGNALKFQLPGAKPVIKVRGRIVGHLFELTVQDNGIGFDEKYSEKIFAVFQRLHGRNEYEGTGVGLAVCRRITDHHGGTITAHSKPGEGARFVVMLPVKQSQTL